MESFEVMDKEEAKVEMKKKPFQDFLMKSSRIIERALDNQFDVIGDFFADDEEEDGMNLKKKKEKIQ